MKRNLFTHSLALGVLLFGVSTASADARSPGLAAGDRKFLLTAAQASMAEVQLSELALKQGSTTEVKAFAQHMVDDHSQMNEKVKKLASDKNVSLPDQVSAEQRKTAEKLSALSGEAFDHEYLDVMLKDHKKVVGMFHKEAKAAKDTDLKALVKEATPTLEDHLKMAKESHQKLRPQGQSSSRGSL